MTPQVSESTLTGFVRDGRPPGVRNHVLVLPSVICSGDVAEAIADRVPRAVCAPHDHGCGQIGADKDQTRRTLVHVAENPNVAGVVLVGLGCETLDSESLAADVDVPVRRTTIQDAGGTDAAIEAGQAAAEALLARERASERRPVEPSALTLGVVVSDQADSTVRNVHPAIGRAVRTVLDSGGRVLVAGIEALLPHLDSVGSVSIDAATADALAESLRGRRERSPPSRSQVDGADRSLDAVTALWDHEPVSDVLEYGERPSSESGFALIDSGPGFEEAATALAAAGAQVVVHGTADGIPTGHPIVPVLKVTGSAETADALRGDIDVDASDDGDDSVVEAVRATADGEATAGEEHGLETFAISRSGPSL